MEQSFVEVLWYSKCLAFRESFLEQEILDIKSASYILSQYVSWITSFVEDKKGAVQENTQETHDP